MSVCVGVPVFHAAPSSGELMTTFIAGLWKRFNGLQGSNCLDLARLGLNKES
jgi:hypothetical protein